MSEAEGLQLADDDSMAGQTPDAPDGSNAAAEEQSIVDQLRQFYSDGRALVDAELGFQKERLRFAGKQARWIGILFFLALITLSSSLLALIIGSLIALGTLLGPWGAMLAVVATCLLLTGLAAWLALGRIKLVKKVFSSEEIERMALERKANQ